MSYFAGKTIWITGASSGIGEALVKQLAKENVQLVLSSRNEAELKRVEKSCSLDPSQTLILPLDLSQTQSLEALTEQVIRRFGRIDILINNGGLSQRSYAKDTPLDIDRRIMEVNYFGTIALTKSVLPHMIGVKSGHIVVTSSVSGKFGFFLRSAYSASKHALHGFFETLRMELYADNIRVTIVCPGRIATPISRHALDASGAPTNKGDANEAIGMDVDKCAKAILVGIGKGKEEFFVGKAKERYALFMKRFFPAVFSGLIRKQKPE